MSTQTTFLNGISSRIQDNEDKLTSANLLDSLADGLRDYNRVRPRKQAADIEGDGTAFLELPDDWEPNFSRVLRLDELDDDGDRERIPITQVRVILNPSPESWILWWEDDVFTDGDTYRLTYTIPHAITAQSSSVPSEDEALVMDAAAGHALLRMAAAYAQSENPAFGTVTIDYRSKVSEYKGLAAEYRKKFEHDLNARRAAGALGKI